MNRKLKRQLIVVWSSGRQVDYGKRKVSIEKKGKLWRRVKKINFLDSLSWNQIGKQISCTVRVISVQRKWLHSVTNEFAEL